MRRLQSNGYIRKYEEAKITSLSHAESQRRINEITAASDTSAREKEMKDRREKKRDGTRGLDIIRE